MSDWVTLLAIFLGPIFAVGITLWIEGRRKKRDARTTILRQLMVTRHLPADPNYSAAVNLVPIEFNDEPQVLAAYKAYQEAIRQPATDNADIIAQHNQLVGARQTKMIFSNMRALGVKGSEADLPIEAYAA